MIEIVYKENKEQANGNEGYFHLPKNIRQVGDTNGRERIFFHIEKLCYGWRQTSCRGSPFMPECIGCFRYFFGCY